ncbi:MAG: hypothetical protein LDLANPLL_00262 [Turneriella sp.]|nr:hypothetical protein [Turneriella sp.]
MDVKRSDMIKWAQSAQLNAESRKEPQTEKIAEAKAPSRTAVSIDALRSKVMGLQQEIHDLQTGISSRQVQLSFLNQVSENSSWQKELRKFMDDKFPAAHLEIKEHQGLDEFKAETLQSVTLLRENLLKKEIQIQNIISAGIFTPPENSSDDAALSLENSKIVKDFTQGRDIFSKLRPETVKNLLH